MEFDRYTIVARLFPAMISAVPFFVLSHYLITPKIDDFVIIVSSYTWVGDLTITAAGVFFLMQISRWISKPLFEDRIFEGGNSFPTTRYLMYSDQKYSADYTKQIHRKIRRDFDIILHTEREEADDPLEARKKIKEAIASIRNTVGKGGLVSQHNIEYGFVRNLAGGAVVGVLVSIVDVFLFYYIVPDYIPFVISIVLLIFYILYVLVASKLIRYLGGNYADVLLNQYMQGRD